jgi:predicted O-linked N-acetylglucosamine transferase (SPINDLY family)
MAAATELLKRAISCFQQGQLAEAERCFRQLLRKEPRHMVALNVLAVVLVTLGRHAEAEPYLQAALQVNPSSDATLHNYGLVLKALGRPDEALLRFTDALAVNPGNAETWNSRGTVLNDLRDHKAAIADFDNALSRNPAYPAAIFNKSRSLTELRRYDEALATCDQALAIKPDLAEAWFGRGFLLHQLRRHEEAADAYANALRIDPKIPFIKGALLHQKMLACDWSGIDRLIAMIDGDIAVGRLSAEPFGWQGIATSDRSLQRCAQLYNAARFPAARGNSAPARTGAGGKIRIGYLSGEFREQATSLLLVGVLEQHDSGRFEVYAIDNGWDDLSATRRRIDRAVHRMIPIRELNDRDALAAIRESRIDILINLNGYFGDGRMRLFAQRAAPVQVNYLGFPGTLGASYIDYIIADPTVLPATSRGFFDEKVVTLPNCYQANDRNRDIAAQILTRAECGLPTTGVVFCCFNNAYKITPEMFSCWMRILSRVEDSVLWLLEDTAAASANLRREAAARGVDGSRIIFAGRLPAAEHLARHRCADLFLDTLPYNAHTTASDALWAGLPLVTCLGQTFAGRVAASLLKNVKLPELITTTLEDYERLAIELATVPERRVAIVQRLEANRLTTPLFDTGLFTRHLEAAYVAMFERHQAGLAPDHIEIG